MNDNSIQNEDTLGEQPSTDDNKALQTGGGDPIDREQNNNGLGELDSSTEAAEPTVKTASIPAASVTALKKAQGVLVSISLGTPCEKVTHEDECCEEPPIVSDTYHAPETPVKTKGGKSKVTHPNEHPKPVNKASNDEGDDWKAKFIWNYDRAVGKNNGQELGLPMELIDGRSDWEHNPEALTPERRDRLMSLLDQYLGGLDTSYKNPFQFSKAEDDHIPTWEEIRKSVANKDTANYLNRLKEYPNDADILDMTLLMNAANSQKKEMGRTWDRHRKDFGSTYLKGRDEIDKMVQALSKLGLAPEIVTKLVNTAYPDDYLNYGRGEGYPSPSPYPDPIMRAVSANVKGYEALRGGKRDENLNSSRAMGRSDALSCYEHSLEQPKPGSPDDEGEIELESDDDESTSFKRGEDHIPTWAEIRKMQECGKDPLSETEEEPDQPEKTPLEEQA